MKYALWRTQRVQDALDAVLQERAPVRFSKAGYRLSKPFPSVLSNGAALRPLLCWPRLYGGALLLS